MVSLHELPPQKLKEVEKLIFADPRAQKFTEISQCVPRIPKGNGISSQETKIHGNQPMCTTNTEEQRNQFTGMTEPDHDKK